MSYLKQILEQIATGNIKTSPGLVTDVTVSHDDWCMIFSGANCNCAPDIILGKPATTTPNRQQRRAKKRRG